MGECGGDGRKMERQDATTAGKRGTRGEEKERRCCPRTEGRLHDGAVASECPSAGAFLLRGGAAAPSREPWERASVADEIVINMRGPA